jgi:hypothetical protein
VGFYTLYHDKQEKYRMQVCTDLALCSCGADGHSWNPVRNLGVRVERRPPLRLITVEAVTCLRSVRQSAHVPTAKRG